MFIIQFLQVVLLIISYLFSLFLGIMAIREGIVVLLGKYELKKFKQNIPVIILWGIALLIFYISSSVVWDVLPKMISELFN